MWKYCGSISQLRFFLFFILFFLSFISLLSIHFIFYLFFFFSPPHTYPVSLFPFLLFSFSLSFKNILVSFHSLFFSLAFSFFVFLLDSRTLTSSLCDKKRKKRGIQRKNKRDRSMCCHSSSSPTQRSLDGSDGFCLLSFLLRCMNFLSRKIHLELLWCFLDQENDYSNFKKKFEKVLHIENRLELVFWAYSPKYRFS